MRKVRAVSITLWTFSAHGTLASWILSSCIMPSCCQTQATCFLLANFPWALWSRRIWYFSFFSHSKTFLSYCTGLFPEVLRWGKLNNNLFQILLRPICKFSTSHPLSLKGLKDSQSIPAFAFRDCKRLCKTTLDNGGGKNLHLPRQLCFSCNETPTLKMLIWPCSLPTALWLITGLQAKVITCNTV